MAGSDRLRGMVAQGMSGRKVSGRPNLLLISDNTSSTGSYTATKDCWALVWAWGPGGSGGKNSTNAGSGAGGGAAGYKRIRLSGGQTISWSVGTPGAAQTSDTTNGNDATDTTVTLPNGLLLTAGGGKKGVQGASPQTGGLAGVATGPWDIARNGGNGGDGITAGGTAGGSPTFGGTGGAGAVRFGGGGGAGGFTDQLTGLTPGNGTTGNSSTAGGAPGAGSAGCASDTGAGGAGRVYLQIIRVPT